jgi:hypothetical protein
MMEEPEMCFFCKFGEGKSSTDELLCRICWSLRQDSCSIMILSLFNCLCVPSCLGEKICSSDDVGHVSSREARLKLHHHP